jgi:hypothetical protein
VNDFKSLDAGKLRFYNEPIIKKTTMGFELRLQESIDIPPLTHFLAIPTFVSAFVSASVCRVRGALRKRGQQWG